MGFGRLEGGCWGMSPGEGGLRSVPDPTPLPLGEGGRRPGEGSPATLPLRTSSPRPSPRGRGSGSSQPGSRNDDSQGVFRIVLHELFATLGLKIPCPAPIQKNVDRNRSRGSPRWRRLAARILDKVLDTVFPPCCMACENWLPGGASRCFCESCGTRIEMLRAPLCPLCGRPWRHEWQGDHLCGACLLQPPSFSVARSWACYPREPDPTHPLRQVVHRFKYGRQASLGQPLGRLMAEFSRSWFSPPDLDLIVPVPLHPRRLRWRGFNQSVLLGREVGSAWGLRLDPFVLTRRKETAPQSGLALKERRPNVRGAFAVASRRSVEGMRLLLVDDIYTSGATVNECARVLMRSGVREVRVLTLARTVS